MLTNTIVCCLVQPVPVWDVRIQGRRKKWSIVRVIGSFLPLPPPPKIRFQRRLVCSSVNNHDSCTTDGDHSSSSISGPFGLGYSSLSLADIPWLDRDQGESWVRFRVQVVETCTRKRLLYHSPNARNRSSMKQTRCCETRSPGPLCSPCQSTHTKSCKTAQAVSQQNPSPAPSDLALMSTPGEQTFIQPLVSTPLNFSSSFQTPDPVALKRITELEDELLRLRQQIASIVIAQEQMIQKQTSIDTSTSQIVPSLVTVPPPVPPVAPPPPPPPPLPAAVKSVNEIILQAKKKKGHSIEKAQKKTEKQVDMSEVLKGIGTVKLRAIKRSPGGTPLRSKPLPAEANDPAALIAQALKRKFAHRRFESPDQEKENINKFSPASKEIWTAKTPPGPHLLRRRSTKHGLPPLTEVNA